MPSHSVFGARVLRPFAYAIAVLVLCALCVSSAKVQTWKVTVDVTNVTSGIAPSISIDPPNSSNPGRCVVSVHPSKPTPGDVYVCPGDTVLWVATTKRGRGEIAVWEKDGVVNHDGKAPHSFHGPANTKVGGVIYSTEGLHHYVVAVYDPDSTNPDVYLYVQDPQIVIGGGRDGGNHKKGSGQK